MEDYNPDVAYCGAGWAKLPATHPFNYAGFLHDRAYYTWPVQSTKPIDKRFLHDCQLIIDNLLDAGIITPAKHSALEAEALCYYKIIRIWGTGRVVNAKLRGYSTLLS